VTWLLNPPGGNHSFRAFCSFPMAISFGWQSNDRIPAEKFP
jgi:hypothetical protein